MVRPKDMRVTFMKEVFTHTSLETGDTGCHAGPHGEAPGSVRRQRGEGKARPQTCSLVTVGKARQGSVNTLGLASLNNFSGLSLGYRDDP